MLQVLFYRQNFQKEVKVGNARSGTSKILRKFISPFPLFCPSVLPHPGECVHPLSPPPPARPGHPPARTHTHAQARGTGRSGKKKQTAIVYFTYVICLAGAQARGLHIGSFEPRPPTPHPHPRGLGYFLFTYIRYKLTASSLATL